ncbi:MAG TPA: hypothetical protein ENK86_04405 [Campylobacterales bacterium]|nr:hypothetical protein [Campylobacterales bacterium]
MRRLLLPLSVALLLLSGCGSRQYYTPQSTHSAASSSVAEVVSFSRDGATLSGGKALNAKQELGFVLEEGYAFINNTSSAAITANRQGNCRIYTPEGSAKAITLPKALVAGTVIENQLVYLLQDNNYGIYDLSSDTVVYNNKAKKAFSIDTRIANPMRVDNLVVIPTLDGKLVVLDLKTHKIAKEIYVTTESSLNNVIFLRRLGNTLIAATPHGVISVSNQGRREFKRAISEVAIDGEHVFVFAKDGLIAKLDESLKVLAEKKFKFAHFSIAGIEGDKLYALDKQGYLIVTNKSFTKHRDYKLPDVEGYGFASAGKLYYDGHRVDLSRLGYE